MTSYEIWSVALGCISLAIGILGLVLGSTANIRLNKINISRAKSKSQSKDQSASSSSSISGTGNQLTQIVIGGGNIPQEIVESLCQILSEKQQINIQRVFQQAASTFQGGQNSAPSEEWLTRFIEGASRSNDDAVTSLWSEILNTEIKEPGFFSLRTLSVVSMLTKEEISLFEEASSTVFDDSFLINEPELPPSLPFASCLHLQECGLINTVAFISDEPSILKNEDLFFRFGSKSLHVYNPQNSEEQISFQIFPLSTSGKELLSLCKNPKNYEYLEKALAYFRNAYPKLTFSIIDGGPDEEPSGSDLSGDHSGLFR
jgi:hypothetical protein